MKKRVVLSVILISIIAVLGLSLASCNINIDGNYAEKRKFHVVFNYCITSQFTMSNSFTMGSLITKPEIPSYNNYLFNAGYSITENGYIGESDLPITNPRMNNGYDADKNYRFIGWYTEIEYYYQWDFSEDRIFRDITLYAKWIEV